jgi:tRNA-splicing ligase RtcB
MTISGTDLIEWGFTPGPWFTRAIEVANGMQRGGETGADIISTITRMAPPPTLGLQPSGAVHFHMNIEAELPGDAENIAKVAEHMNELMRVPVVRHGAVMPDACPSGSEPGTIPVGGVIASSHIHPGMHSADICCSMAMTTFDRDADPTAILDAGMKLSHFGPGGRSRETQLRFPSELLAAFEGNHFLRDIVKCAREHFGTQGDGNHFFYVGRIASTGQIALVTHHGSRKPGALLYKAGMRVAEDTRLRVSPETGEHNAWIDANSLMGDAYWSALQVIREFTKRSHFAIHDAVGNSLGLRPVDRIWNEHNFVFRKTDGLFYHAKGATPAFPGYADDASGLTLIPLNMAAPILIVKGLDAPNGLGFAPHGAGRNLSRTQYMRENAGKTTEELFAAQAPGIDARAFSGVQDVSELPGAYKNADMVRRQIEKFKLARVDYTIEPIGSIMAGQQDEPWRARREAKRALAAKTAEAV